MRSISFEVVEPSEMSIVEVFDERVIPPCSGDGAQLVFEVIGGALNAGLILLKYKTVLSLVLRLVEQVEKLQSVGLTNNLGQLTNYTITDVNGCSTTATLTTMIQLPQFMIQVSKLMVTILIVLMVKKVELIFH